MDKIDNTVGSRVPFIKADHPLIVRNRRFVHTLHSCKGLSENGKSGSDLQM